MLTFKPIASLFSAIDSLKISWSCFSVRWSGEIEMKERLTFSKVWREKKHHVERQVRRATTRVHIILTLESSRLESGFPMAGVRPPSLLAETSAPIPAEDGAGSVSSSFSSMTTALP
jgi:hypothetical protein